jgi:uncharacterized protein YndB with AHSA1/START domain
VIAVGLCEPADPVPSRTFRLLTPAPPDRVWRTLTCPSESARYLHGLSVRAIWQPGERVILRAPGCPPLEGTVLHVDAPQLLTYTVEDAGTCTYLTWSLRGTDRGTVVRLQVEEAAGTPSAAELDEVWLPVLDRLSGLLA